MIADRPVGQLLREWRQRRRLSQLDLAIQADVSARHVSFVETGRTVPSSAMVLHLAEHLGVPLRERNRLLVAAGHAPLYRHRPLDDPDMARAREAIERFVHAHEPYPALAVDRRWNLVLANSAIDVFLDGVDPSLLCPPVNMMRLGLHPDGLAPRIGNLAQVRGYLLPRLARQAAQSGDPGLNALHEELLSYGSGDERPTLDPADIVLTIHIEHRGARLCFRQRDHDLRRRLRHRAGGGSHRDVPARRRRDHSVLLGGQVKTAAPAAEVRPPAPREETR